MVDIKAQLKEHLRNGQDWEKMKTPITGIHVVKVPATKTRPSLLFLEINPLNSEGRPYKRKGLFIGNREMLLKFSEALADDKVYQLIQEFVILLNLSTEDLYDRILAFWLYKIVKK